MADQTMSGVLTSTSPLRVRIIGADTDSPAGWIGNGTGASIGDRVQVSCRNPQVPLVQGKTA